MPIEIESNVASEGFNVFGVNSLVIGSIEWGQAMGRPKVSTLHHAFKISGWQHFVVNVPGVDEINFKIPISFSAYDGPHDDNKYRVGFVASLLAGDYSVRVEILDGVQWSMPVNALSASQPLILQQDRHFSKSNNLLVLPPFVVLPV